MRKAFSTVSLFAISLWICTGALSLLQAQATDTDTSKQLAPAGQALTDESLQQVLTNMGYEPKKIQSGFLVEFKQDDWTMYVQVSLSPDQTKLGLTANLGTVDESSVSAPEWMNLLAGNSQTDPSFFYYDKDAKKLYMHRALDNRGITASVLRKNLDNFSSDIRTTKDLWKFTK